MNSYLLKLPNMSWTELYDLFYIAMPNANTAAALDAKIARIIPPENRFKTKINAFSCFLGSDSGGVVRCFCFTTKPVRDVERKFS